MFNEFSASDPKFAYVVILVDDPKDVMELNEVFRYIESSNFKIQAFYAGHPLHGINHRGNRPTHIIDAIQDRNHPKFKEWYEACILPKTKNAVLIGGDNDGRNK